MHWPGSKLLSINFCIVVYFNIILVNIASVTGSVGHGGLKMYSEDVQESIYGGIMNPLRAATIINADISNGAAMHRQKRDTSNENSSDKPEKSSKPKNVLKPESGHEPAVTHFELMDPHHQVMVGWAGEGSQVIVCVTKDSVQTAKSTSKVYISYDYGTTYLNKTSEFLIEGNKTAIILKFYKNEKFTDRFLFADTINKYLFVTMDYGHTIYPRKLSFSPTEVSNHPTNALIIIVLDTEDKMRKLWVTSDFGESWRILSFYVKQYYWSDKTSPPTLYVEREAPGMDNRVLAYQKFSSIGEFEYNIVMNDVQDFKVAEDFLFAVKKKPKLYGETSHEDTLQLWISYNSGPFLLSEFPNNLTHQDYYVADISYGQIMVCVFHGISSNLYVSTAPSSSEKQIRFSLSLERILYFHPFTNWNDTWLQKVAEDPFADIHRVKGIRGVFIASQLYSNFSKTSVLGPEHLTSVITFDLGGEWKPIGAPKVDHEGLKTDCKIENGCSLHISQEMASLYPGSRSKPILSAESAPGLILSSGTLGTSLKGHVGVFLSTDAGVNWYQILRGNFLYTFGDHGAILIAVEHYPLNSPTNEIIYSTDEGETWQSYNFTVDPMKVYGLMIEPGENTTIFTLFGSREEKHEWILVKIDMRPVFNSKCKKDDYKTWSPTLYEPGSGFLCLLGRKDIYEKRNVHSNCYNGINYDRPISEENCPCSRSDYECDYGFKTNSKDEECIKDSSDLVNPLSVPASCKEEGFYNRTKGYRKIAGDTCYGGLDALYEPEVIACPLKEEREFFLISSRKKILRYDLLNPSAGLKELPVPGLDAVIALDFDLTNNCLYWSDAASKKINRQCFDGEHKIEVLIETNIDSVEGMALDWISKNLYFVDGGRKTVELIRVDSSDFSGRLRSTLLNGTNLDLPRGIALHPIKGYMFITDWSETKPMVARADLDGSNIKKLFGSELVGWPNGITVDFQSDKIFWADAKMDYIASSDLDGKDFRKVVSDNEYVKQPFAVGVYKSMIFWDDWSMFQVYQADKDHGWAVTPISHTPMEGLVDLKVYGHWSQLGSNACGDKSTNNCQFLCMGTPDNSFSCRCPDWMKTVKIGNHNKCVCGDDSEPSTSGACLATDNTCSTDFFKCDNNYCIPKTLLCDKDNDCGDWSDEKNCGSKSCDASSWQCKNGHCISPAWQCDIDNDCGDNSDEEDCHYPTCADSEFTCQNKRCIDKRWICDLQDDCRDGSDESNCTLPGNDKGHAPCRNTQFQCKTSRVCLPISWRCDGESDCGDGSDELECKTHKCNAWQFQCSSKRCIYSTWVCDGEKDCEDGSDEVNCTNTTPKPIVPIVPLFPNGGANVTCSSFEFRCTSGSCIPFWWRCDRAMDCNDGSDEDDCGDSIPSIPTLAPKNVTTKKPITYTCREDQMECSNGECIWEAWVCDGDKDCSSGEDEENCNQARRCQSNEFRCWHSEGCINAKLRCNNHIDCADGSDEMGCLPIPTEPPSGLPKCEEGFFSCDGGNCLHDSKKCDGNMDCIDMTDENNCTSHTEKVYQVSSVKSNKATNTSLSFVWMIDVDNPEYFEFKPSCIIKAALGNPNAWRNGTWTNKTEYTFEQLEPYTNYLIKVYVREKKSLNEYPPAEVLAMETFVGIPSPPLAVKVTQVGQEFQVEWSEPHRPSGPLETYQVYVTPPKPPRVYKVEARNHAFTLSSQKHQNFTVWLTVSNTMYTSEYSEKVNFTAANVDQPVNGLSLKSQNLSAVEIIWEPLNEVDGYTVSYMYPENQFMGYKNFVNVTAPKILFHRLAPGTKYVFEVQGFKGNAIGPFTALEVTTLGDKLPNVAQLKHAVQKYPGTEVKISWEAPPYKQKHLWQYQVIWGKTISELKRRLNAGTTTNSTYTVRHLDACETYMMAVMISGPIGTGPAEPFQVQTSEDPLAPPKNLKAKAKDEYMQITWESPCPQAMDNNLSYLVNITETTLNRSFLFEIPAMKNNLTQGYRVNMHRGGHYTIIVRTYLNNSRPSAPVHISGPTISEPFELTYNPSDGSFFWRDQKSMPLDLLKSNHSYMLYLSRIDHNNSEPEIAVEVKSPPYVATEMSPGQVYYASVSFKDSDGYLSPPSLGIRVEKPIGDDIVLTPTSVVSVAVSVTAIIILLVVVVGVLAVRHKRLARSFSAFANSHYDRFQGTTVISTDHNLDEDDSPMIRGFSDDEPLVIA